MSISGVGAGNPPAVQSMINLQNQLDQLSQELGSSHQRLQQCHHRCWY